MCNCLGDRRIERFEAPAVRIADRSNAGKAIDQDLPKRQGCRRDDGPGGSGRSYRLGRSEYAEMSTNMQGSVITARLPGRPADHVLDRGRSAAGVVRLKQWSNPSEGLEGNDAPSGAEIVDLVHVYVDLKEEDGVYRAYCPFCHKDEHSFVLDPQSGQWRCERCGDGGDVYRFFERLRRRSREDAVRFVSRLLSSTRRRVDPGPAVIRTPLVHSKGSDEPAGGLGPDQAGIPQPLPAESSSEPEVTIELVAPSEEGGIAGEVEAVGAEREVDQTGVSGGVVDRTGGDSPATVVDECPSASQRPGGGPERPTGVEVAPAVGGEEEPGGGTGRSIAQAPRPSGGNVSEGLGHLIERIADSIRETPACRGIAFVENDERGDPQVATRYLDELDRNEILVVERFMRLAVEGAHKVLGGGEGPGTTLVTLRARRRGEPLDLVWCPIESETLRFNALISIDPKVAEGLLVMRLRHCVNKAIGE